MTTLCLTVVVLQTIALWIGYTLSPQQRKVRITPFELSDTFMLTSTRRKLMEKQKDNEEDNQVFFNSNLLRRKS
jgi:hypothetical protein